jgi:hypothetical protein
MNRSSLSDDAILELINNGNTSECDINSDVSGDEDYGIPDPLGAHDDIAMDINELLEENDKYFSQFSNSNINLFIDSNTERTETCVQTNKLCSSNTNLHNTNFSSNISVPPTKYVNYMKWKKKKGFKKKTKKSNPMNTMITKEPDGHRLIILISILTTRQFKTW